MKRISIVMALVLLVMVMMTACQKKPTTTGGGTKSSGTSSSDAIVNDVSDDASDDASDDSILTEPDQSSAEGGGTKAVTSKTTKKTSNGSSSVKLVKDLKGREFVIATAQPYVKRSMGVSDLDDAYIMRDRNIEKMFNCKITYIYDESLFNNARAAIMSGEKYADVICAPLFDTARMYATNLLYNMNGMPGVNYNDSCWDKQLEKLMTFPDGKYAVMPKSVGGIVHFNSTLLKKLGIKEDPITLTQQGKWTWDKMSAMIRTAAKDNGDGKWDEKDTWGCTSSSYDGIVPFFTTSGVNIVTRDKSGKLQYNLNNSAATSAYVKFQSMLTGKGIYYAAEYKKQVSLYTSGKALFFIGGSGYMEIGNGEDSIVPMPNMIASSSYKAPNSHNTPVYSIPKTIKNDEKSTVGMLLQAYADQTMSITNAWIKTYIDEPFSDERIPSLVRKYVLSSGSYDSYLLMQSLDMSIYNATTCAIGNPIMSNGSEAHSVLVSVYHQPAQEKINEIFNARYK